MQSKTAIPERSITHQESPTLAPTFCLGANFPTTAQRARVQAEQGSPAKLRRQRLEFRVRGMARICRARHSTALRFADGAVDTQAEGVSYGSRAESWGYVWVRSHVAQEILVALCWREQQSYQRSSSSAEKSNPTEHV